MTVTRHAFPFELKAADPAADAPLGQMEAIVSVFSNTDMGNDTIELGAFAKSIATKLPKGVWGHDWSQPVAKTLEARELPPGDPLLPPELMDLGGLYIKAQFNLETQRGSEAYSDVKNGLIDEFSIGYSVRDFERDQKSGGRRLKELGLAEWSPVLVGMNRATALLSVKDGKAGFGDVLEPPDTADGSSENDDDRDDVQTGVMIGWFLDEATANALAVPGGEPANRLHLTLAMLGQAGDYDAFARARLMVALESFVQYRDPLSGTIGGYGRFTNAEDGDPDVYYASVDIPALEDLQDDLCDALARFGFEVNTEHGFVPHITLAYLDAGAANPAAPEPMEVTIDGLTVAFGPDRATAPFPVFPTFLPYMFGYLGAERGEEKAADATEPESKATMTEGDGFPPQSPREGTAPHRKGTPVKWAHGRGNGYGKVVSAHTDGVVPSPESDAKASVFGSKKNPGYRIRVHTRSADGETFTATDRHVAKRHSSLAKMDAMPLAAKGDAEGKALPIVAAKGAPRSGLPFGGEVDAARLAVSSCVDRALSVRDMYRKEGRALNGTNVSRLSDMRDELRTHADTLDTMLTENDAAADPGDTKAALRRVRLQFLETENRILSLPLSP